MKQPQQKKVKKSPRKRKIKFKVKLTPKKVPKKVFNPFGLDLSTDVEKMLGFDSQKNMGYFAGRKYALVTGKQDICKNQQVLGYLEQETNERREDRINQRKDMRSLKKVVTATDHQIKYKQKYTQRRIFKKEPLRRHETDMIMFKEVFVAPRQQKLMKLRQKKGYNDDSDEEKEEINPHFKELVKEEKDPNEIKIKKRKKSKKQGKEKGKYNQIKTLLANEANLQQSPQTVIKGQKPDHECEPKSPQKKTVPIVIHGSTNKPEEEKSFFESQILVQPTEMPNATIASPLTPGNGWAPSLPLLNLKNTNKESVKDLLIRANAGMQAGDIQKEAHLTFYLGVIHEANRNYKQAIKFHKKFYSCAKLMEDKVGMALAMNRIGINLFNSGQKKRSIEYHLKNVDFTDQENAFAGLYNLGISYRSIGDHTKAIKFFEKALAWATERKVYLIPKQIFDVFRKLNQNVFLMDNQA